MFRWSYIFPRLLILLAIFVFLRFGMNPLLRYALIASTQSATGTKVEIGQVQSSLLDGDIYLADLEIADPRDPSKNLIQAKHALLNIDRDALLQRKYVVTEGRISEIQWGANRTTDGSLDPGARSSASESQIAEHLQQVAHQWLDGFIDRLEADAREEFETIQVTEELIRRWPKEYEQLNRDLVTWQENIESLQRVYEEMRVNPLRSVEYYRKRLAEIQHLQAEIVRIREEAERLHQQIGTDREAIVQAKQRDEEKIREALRLESLDSQALSDYLLGEEVAQQVATTLAWVQRGRDILQVANVKPDLTQERGVGRVVPFGPQDTPNVLFEKLAFDGFTTHQGETVLFQGLLKDATTEPSLHGTPATLSLATRGPLEVQLEATFDRTRKKASDHFVVTCPNVARPERSLGSNERLAIIVGPGKSTISLDLQIEQGMCAGTITLYQDDVRLTSHVSDALGGQRVAEHINGALFSVRDIDTQVHLSGNIKRPQLRVESNLGGALAEGINGAVQGELNYQAQRMLAKVDDRLSKEAGRFDSVVQQHEQHLLRKLEVNETQIRQFQDVLAERFGGAGTLSARRLLDKTDAIKNMIFK